MHKCLSSCLCLLVLGCGVWLCLSHLVPGCDKTQQPPSEEETIRARVAELADDRDEVRFASYVDLLRRGKAAEPHLLEALVHPNPEARYQAAAILRSRARVLGTEAVPPLETAARDPDPRVRTNAIQALGVMGPKARSIAATLREALADPNLGVARDAVAALGQVLGAGAVPDLTALLHDPQLRRWAAEALGRIGPAAAEAVPALQSLTQSGNQAEQRAAKDALNCIRPAR